MAVGCLATSCSSDEQDADGGEGGTTSPATTPASAVTTPPESVPPNGESVLVAATDNLFRPDETTVAAGTEVVWENRGRNEHNIIPEDESAPWRVEVEDFMPGDKSSFVFSTPGTYRYFCSIHGTIDAGMPGVIVVT